MDDLDWRAELGFSDRLTAVQSLATAYRQASSTAAFTAAQSHAKKLEEEAYDKAASKEEYDRMLQATIDASEAAGPAIPVISNPGHIQDEPKEQPKIEAERIGNYGPCYYHVEGLHSTLYKSQNKDGNLVAMKVTVPHLLAAPHDIEREIRILREGASAHVISLWETFRLNDGRLILIFPFMRYDFEYLLRRDIVTAAQIRSHLRDMLCALAHLHGLGIIHRDIKPSNLLMDSAEGPAYLGDFGVAWKGGGKGSEPADQKVTDVGTTCYRPPEILFGFKGYGTALDLWAAGCVIAEAISVGHRPLFDAGPVGSDLSLIQSIFMTIGTPNEEIWPEIRNLPDWGKIEFHQYPSKPWAEVLKGASSNGRGLVAQLVRYESSQRVSATEALKHPYFSGLYLSEPSSTQRI